MGEKLKNMFFTGDSINKFTESIIQHYPEFDRDKFVKLIYYDEWEAKELKEKMRHISLCLHEVLPGEYEKAVDILIKIAPEIKGFEAITLPDYVEVYGQDYRELSLSALGVFTRYSSSEFAIRPFLADDPDTVMEYMSKWAGDEHENVRRFASEGCRPRLPWAMALPKFKKDPSLILPILEKLKNDESEFVRRSVANNLNDISKDNPDIALATCEKWYGKSEKTDKIVKHACRGLLKAGNKRALLIFGYSDPAKMMVENFLLKNERIVIGEYLHFSFDLVLPGKETSKVRLEYRIDFVKSNGKLSGKVFKITENDYKPGRHSYSRKHSFIDMSTRTHYEGTHEIAIHINGEEKAKTSLEVKK